MLRSGIAAVNGSRGNRTDGPVKPKLKQSWKAGDQITGSINVVVVPITFRSRVSGGKGGYEMKRKRT